MREREMLKKTLEQLHNDRIIDCNQYQGEDFTGLLERIRGENGR